MLRGFEHTVLEGISCIAEGRAAIAISRGGALLDARGAVLPLREARAMFSRLQVQEALRQAGGVQQQAARLLGMDPGNLSRLLKELGMR